MSEHTDQCALIEWAEKQACIYPELDLLYAIPNGTRTTRGTAGKMKAEGVKEGVPDLFLPVARGGYHGLYIELKTIYASGRRGKVKPAQSAWLKALREQGYRAAVCYGWTDAKELIISYLSLE